MSDEEKMSKKGMPKAERGAAVLAFFLTHWALGKRNFTHTEVASVLDVPPPERGVGSQAYYSAVSFARQELLKHNIALGSNRTSEGKEGGYQLLTASEHQIRNARECDNALKRIAKEVIWMEMLFKRIDSGEDAGFLKAEDAMWRHFVGDLSYVVTSTSSKKKSLTEVRTEVMENEKLRTAAEALLEDTTSKDKQKQLVAQRKLTSIRGKLSRRERKLEELVESYERVLEENKQLRETQKDEAA